MKGVLKRKPRGLVHPDLGHVPTQNLYAVGRVGDAFAHYVRPSREWDTAEAICGTRLFQDPAFGGSLQETWQPRTGTGRVCNACQALASRMRPFAIVRRPRSKWLGAAQSR